MSRIIEIIVSPQGETTVQTKGFAGETCRDATKELEASLGLKSCERMTGDYYVEAPAEQTSQN